MGISPVDIKIIARGAFLHDIGKMAIPDEILRKPGKLTPRRAGLMREHCTRGYHMLRKIPFLAGAAEIVFSPPGALRWQRLSQRPARQRDSHRRPHLRCRRCLDAITSDRPYRKAESFDTAREEILRCSGTQFDPAVVEVFLKIPNELWQELRCRNQRPEPALLHLRNSAAHPPAASRAAQGSHSSARREREASAFSRKSDSSTILGTQEHESGPDFQSGRKGLL